MGLVHSMEGRPARIDLANVRSDMSRMTHMTRKQTSEVRFFEIHSARCVFSVASEIIYARPLERGGSVKPRSFCLSLKFASIDRNSVLIQLREGQFTT